MENLQELLDSHRDWLHDDWGGERLVLHHANLCAANLGEADLRKADLQNADLVSANLQRARLRGANLQGTNMYAANLVWADLQSVSLQGANLQRASLQHADLTGADLRGANLWRANLEGANLCGAIGIVGFSSTNDMWDVYGVLHDTGDERVVFIKAGCRWFTAADARKHWIATRGGTALGEERIAIVNFLESMLLNRSKEWN